MAQRRNDENDVLSRCGKEDERQSGLNGFKLFWIFGAYEWGPFE